MRNLTATDRRSLVRLASTMPVGNTERREILRFLVAETPLEEREFTNPESGNKVKFTSLPKEEQAKIRKKLKKDDGDDKGLSGKVKGWLNKAKGITAKGKKTLQDLPGNAQQFVTDSEFRNKVTSEAASKLKAAPGKFAEDVMHHFAEEVEHVAGGLTAMSKGQLPDKHQAEAMAGLAIEVAVAGLALGTAGWGGAGVKLGVSLCKHLALSAIHPLLGKGYVFGFEGSHLIHAVEGFLHIAAEDDGKKEDKKKEDKKKKDGEGSTDPNKFVEDLVKAVADALEKGVDEKTMIKALNAA